MHHIKLAVLVLSAWLLAMACSVQKRVYRKGFYVQSRHQMPHQDRVKSKPAPLPLMPDRPTDSPKDLFAAASLPLPPVQTTPSDRLICDSLYFKDGSVLAVKLLEIGPKDLKYKLCDHLEGPDYLVEKFRVNAILFSNGKRETFNEQNPMPPSRYELHQKQYGNGNEKNVNAALSLSFGILGIYPLIFLGSLIGIVFSILAFSDFKRYPGRYSNETMGKAGFGLSIAGLALWLIVILLFII